MKHSTTSRAPARLLSTIGLATGLALTVSACSTGTPSADGSTGTARPHGYVAGASESQEPQVRLLAVSATGATALHDLLTEETTELDDVDAPEHSATDGRFLVTSDADRTTIVDGGSWTVDHGDHTHYYAAEPRVVGTIDGGGRVEVHSSETMTTIAWPDRAEAVVLDREALGQGEVDETARIDASVLLPMGEQLVAADGDTVRVLDADGEATAAGAAAAAEQACTDPAGGIVTRAGAVVGCADGAVVVDDAGGTSFVDLPDGAERPTAFAARAGRPTVAGLAGTTGFWLLDVRQGSWRLVPTDRPLRAVVAVDDEDEHVVGVDDSGRVVVVTASTGKVATTTALIDTGADGPAPMLQLDAQRAYVADPADGTVHEIDFADGARAARTIELPVTPVAFAEVGL
ncbi:MULTISPECIES: ABC transporter [unclassified Curtobacterium]|uniref:ABC transporter n=1 Tax=unclassified Curtobacterium TaxID=257496 RepID=UPI000DA8977C|nr:MULTISPECIES: ABC transporter [unclassified Curtobacterium]PZF40541.1 ABC transporter [Curtobacterium sp. MCLR17_053]PZF47895.1 ABC transporter [Curtobacterium sp. MCLR17_051]